MATINPLNSAALAAQAAQERATASAKSAFNLFKEAHPFARKAVVLEAHSVPWIVYARKIGRAAVVYVPGITLVLGWPMLAKWVINYSNGVYDAPTKKAGRR